MFISVTVGVLTIFATPVFATPCTIQHQYEGTLGTGSVGMTIVRDGNKIEGGHYFYRKFLTDIPITGSFNGSSILLTEPGEGKFTLHFVGNGSNGAQPLDFENSIGMEGTWASSDGTKTYPVSLRGTLVHEPGWDGQRYSDIAKKDRSDFEKRVQTFINVVLKHDKAEAVRLIDYPLLVDSPNLRNVKLRNAAAVLANWNELFSPAMLAVFQKALPHDMFVHDGMAMIGHGEAWFDGKGLAGLNVPSNSPVPHR